MGSTFFRTAIRDDRETEITVEVEVHSWGSAPQTYGPPESCDPGEPMEIEIINCWLLEGDDEPQPFKPVIVALTDLERQRIEGEFCEDPPEADYPDYDDWRD